MTRIRPLPYAPAPRAILLRDAALQLAILAIVVVVAISAPPPARRQIAVGTPGDEAYLAEFWQPEQNERDTFRWTNGEGVIWLRDYASVSALLVSIRLSRPAGADVPPAELTLRSDERTVAVAPVTAGWRTYHLLLAPDGTAWRTPNIDLLSPTFRAGPNDLRRLGVVVSDIAIRPAGGQLPLVLLLRALYLAALVVLVRLWVQVFAPARYALAASLAAGLLAALLWRLDPAGVDRLLPSPWIMALATTGVALALVAVAHWRRTRTAPAVFPQPLVAMLVVAPLAAAALVTALLSLQWRMLHDAPLLMYMAFLIDRAQAVPYRDLFDQNMPGALAFYVFVGRIFGYGDQGFRLADLTVLTLLSACTWLWCRRINGWYAGAAVALFALLYLNYGQSISLQRDYVLLLPIAASLAVAVAPLGRLRRLFLAGLLFGVAATIKPHAAIGFPLLVLFLLADDAPGPPRRSLLQGVAVAFLGLLLPPAACAVYLYASGAGDAFLDMVVNYLPLFARLTGTHQTIAGMERVRYLVEGYLALGNHYLWLLTALVGAAVALRWGGLERPQRHQVLLMLGFALAYSLYPLAQGRFWPYHYVPFLYTLALLSALCVVPQPKQRRLIGQIAPALLLVLVVAVRVWLPVELSYQITGHPLPPIKAGRVDELTAYLEDRVRPGETVQPLDWTGGALHAMLNAGTPIATPFIYDFQFYHHVSTPYIQGLRRRFIADLEASRPRFILDMDDQSTIMTGADTSTTFPALEALLAREYTLVARGNGYAIYERQ